MADNRRVQRVEKELQHIVAKYLHRGFKGSLKGLVSVSRVVSNEKLRTAKVYVSVLGSEDDTEASLESLREHTPDIQKHVNSQLRMKFVPRVSLHLDTSLEKVLKVESLLREISQKKATDDGSDE